MKDKLDDLVRRGQISDAGARFLKVALDPFHDYELTPAGYPDADSSATVVETIRQTFTITKPTGLAAGSTWDCHLASLPELLNCSSPAIGTIKSSAYNVGFTGSAQYPNIWIAGDDANPVSICPVVWNTVLSGQTTFPADRANLWDPTNFVTNQADMTSGLTFQNSPCRVIGWGIEVHDTTAELYKQGAVTVYRMPQDTVVSWGATQELNATATRSGMITLSRRPPSNLAGCFQYAGTRQWEARDGVYLTVTQNGIDNPLSENTSTARFFAGTSPSALVGTTTYTTGFGQGIKQFPSASTGATNAVDGAGFCHPLPFNTCGAYFTGLNENSSLNVVVKMIVEFAPGNGQGDLARLASPSAPLDSRALELYAEAVSMLPPGVPVGENDHGDWYRKVLRTIEMAAPLVGMGLSAVPGANALGQAIGTAAGAAEYFFDQKDKRKAEKQKDKAAPAKQPPKQPGMATKRK